MFQDVMKSNTSRSKSSNLDELTDEELIKQINDLKQQIKVVQLENEVLERVITRLEPTLMHGIQQALEYAMRIHSSTSLGVGSFVRSQTSRFCGMDSIASPSRMLTSPSRISTRRIDSSAKISGTIVFGAGPRINVLERSELVSAEMEILVTNMEKLRSKAASKHALLKAQLEEIGIRVVDIEKACGFFNKEVVIEGWDKIAQRIPAEIWIRFMTEWVKIADSQIGKLRLRTSTLNNQFSKLKGQIKVKAELSESLRPVDFDKLKIENDDCLEIIDAKVQQLVELKRLTGDANLNLTVHKKAMMDQNMYLTRVLKRIKDRERNVVKLDKERDVIQVEADSLAQKLEDVKNVRLSYEVPDVMDYVNVKAEVTDLTHSVKLLENRVRILEITLNSLTKKLNSMFIKN